MSSLIKLALSISTNDNVDDLLMQYIAKSEEGASDEEKENGLVFSIDSAKAIKERKEKERLALEQELEARERQRNIDRLKNMGIGAAGTLGLLGGAYLVRDRIGRRNKKR